MIAIDHLRTDIASFQHHDCKRYLSQYFSNSSLITHIRSRIEAQKIAAYCIILAYLILAYRSAAKSDSSFYFVHSECSTQNVRPSVVEPPVVEPSVVEFSVVEFSPSSCGFNALF